MSAKKNNSKKGSFTLAPIRLADPIRATDGFTNLVELPAETAQPEAAPVKVETSETPVVVKQTAPKARTKPVVAVTTRTTETNKVSGGHEHRLAQTELMQILEADSLDDIYELSDVLRASSLKLYATLVSIADSRGRARIKNHELMSKSGIKGIATLYKQERWLTSLKLVEKKAKPGPHDGSSYVVYKLETLPLPEEIYQKFNDYLGAMSTA